MRRRERAVSRDGSGTRTRSPACASPRSPPHRRTVGAGDSVSWRGRGRCSPTACATRPAGRAPVGVRSWSKRPERAPGPAGRRGRAAGAPRRLGGRRAAGRGESLGGGTTRSAAGGRDARTAVSRGQSPGRGRLASARPPVEVGASGRRARAQASALRTRGSSSPRSATISAVASGSFAHESTSSASRGLPRLSSDGSRFASASRRPRTG